MKNLWILIVISAFSFMVFGEGEKSAEAAEAPKMAEEAKADEEKKPMPMAKEKQAVKEAKPMAKEEAKPAEAKPMAKEEAKPAEAKPVAKEEAKSAEEKQMPQQPVVSEEKPAAVQEAGGAEAGSVQAGVKYECDGGKSYTLHEPGVNDESHLCELDAGHTEAAADWYALNQSSFCKEKLQELIELYNCAVK